MDSILPLEPLPESLRPLVECHWNNFLESVGAVPACLTPERLDELVRVWAVSDFIAQTCIRHPELLVDLIESGDLDRPYPEGHLVERLRAALDCTGDDNTLGVALRRFRRREMVRIAWRDIAGRADLAEVTGTLSDLADACIDQALARLHDWHVAQWGEPVGVESGEPQRLVVLGMGKLGARELNFSSDIDLIFTYPEEGETRGGRRAIANQEFFIRLGQRLITALNQTTAEGFVFRVDMRLRPFGESSALAIGFDAVEAYYQVHGREWERYAMIKARVVAGDREAGAALMETLRPFVYRRYIDFGAFESLRDMKAMIEQEVRRKGMEENVKLGAGGIREVEFIGQAFQLIRGGREPALRIRPILAVLAAVRDFEWLPGFVVRELVDAYTFLRTVEHRLQELADQQTHNLPADPVGRTRLAFAMGFADWPPFEKRLRAHMQRVHSHFDQVFAAPQTEHAETDRLDLTGVWRGSQDETQAAEALRAAGFRDAEALISPIAALRESRACRSLSAGGRGRLDRLMPLLLGAAGGTDNADETLRRLLRLVESITRRTAYLALLVENPVALSQLVRLCAASPWISDLLARHPLLLDELLDPRTLYEPPGRDELAFDLRQRLQGIDPDDLEQQMEVLRHFRHGNVLRVAAADVMEAIPLMVVSDHLTWIAEVILDEVLAIAWRHLIARHGRPPCGERVCDSGFAIVGYGKLGGIELGYGSDLDLVFLHSAEGDGRMTDGEKPIDSAVFYARLAQRIIHLLATRTAAGALYEVDIRLRPSGSSGLMVSSTSAFTRYQREDAWTWEHQALVRARVVAGDPEVAERFAAVRRETLTRDRNRELLRTEVREMRERMRRELDKGDESGFDLKQGSGGIADIEFVVQYGVLAWAHAHPALLEYTDTIRLLSGLAGAGVLQEADTALLSDAYRVYRNEVHRRTLQEQPAVVEPAPFAEYRNEVTRIWRGLMEP